MYKYRVVVPLYVRTRHTCTWYPTTKGKKGKRKEKKTNIKFRNAALITHGEPFSVSIMAYANVLLADIRCELFLQLFETPSHAV